MIKKYFEFINEASEEALKQNKMERTFLKKMLELSDSFLNEEEADIEHPVNDKLSEIILNLFDKKYYKIFASEKGITEDNYKEAIKDAREAIDKYKNSKGGQKEINRFLKKKEKEEKNLKNEDTEESDD